MFQPQLSASSHDVRAGSLNRLPQPEAVDNDSRRLQDLARGIRRLEDAVEANPNADLIRELDQLRVEYRFQLHMNERSRTRSLNAPYPRPSDVVCEIDYLCFRNCF